ncbi:MAG TPA: tagatose 1,6-diphosphate aldolase [Terriglobia bacterium]|nr:tagatose 1,6-diphosphate aldolase [Terriglobia bacterium]
MMNVSPGKKKGLTTLSNARGVIAAMALDQRGRLQALMAAAGGSEPTQAMIEEFKTAVTLALSPKASAILLDLEFGQPAMKVRHPSTGLLMTYEMDSYTNHRPGRRPEIIPQLSIRRLKDAGADGIKVLLHYSPFADRDLNEEKHAFVERIGSECRAEDIPFFLEIVGYDPNGLSEQSLEYARLKPQIVSGGLTEFSRGRYGVDVLKVEFPVNLKFVEGSRSFAGQSAYSLAEALEFFRQSGVAATLPFVYLSAGVSNSEFVEGLALAAQAHAPYSGVLCGRAIWSDGIQAYVQRGVPSLESWLETEGKKNIEAVITQLAQATPWFNRGLP